MRGGETGGMSSQGDLWSLFTALNYDIEFAHKSVY